MIETIKHIGEDAVWVFARRVRGSTYLLTSSEVDLLYVYARKLKGKFTLPELIIETPRDRVQMFGVTVESARHTIEKRTGKGTGLYRVVFSHERLSLEETYRNTKYQLRMWE